MLLCVAHAHGTFGCFHRKREETNTRRKKKKADAIFHLFLLFVLSTQNDDVFECVCMSFAKNVFLLFIYSSNFVQFLGFIHVLSSGSHCAAQLVQSLYSPWTNDWYGGISQMSKKKFPKNCGKKMHRDGSNESQLQETFAFHHFTSKCSQTHFFFIIANRWKIYSTQIKC